MSGEYLRERLLVLAYGRCGEGVDEVFSDERGESATAGEVYCKGEAESEYADEAEAYIFEYQLIIMGGVRHASWPRMRRPPAATKLHLMRRSAARQTPDQKAFGGVSRAGERMPDTMT